MIGGAQTWGGPVQLMVQEEMLRCLDESPGKLKSTPSHALYEPGKKNHVLMAH